MSRVDVLCALLYTDAGWRDPNPARSKVTAIGHALSTATRARRHDPRDAQMIVAALLHDAARPLCDVFHGQVIAEVLRDRVRPGVYVALRDHGAWQAAYLAGAPCPAGPVEGEHLAGWDAASFDPAYHPDLFASFLPELRRVLGE